MRGQDVNKRERMYDSSDHRYFLPRCLRALPAGVRRLANCGEADARALHHRVASGRGGGELARGAEHPTLQSRCHTGEVGPPGKKGGRLCGVEGCAWGASFEMSREAMGAVRREMALVRSEESACVRERSCLYTRLPHAHAHKPRAPMWDCCTYGSQAHRSRAWVTDTDCSDASPDCLGILPDHVLGLALLLRARIATRHVRWGDREGRKRERSGLQVDDL